MIRQNSKITAKELADTLKLSKRQCERIIADLKNRGILSRKGTNRTGYWIITGS
ncbi:winged helix-turn-helix transcriptional regulator [Bacteroides finegoldii]|uniref:winged helix-turn-helix transcriptional regulator n=1 Tax=Bacteroides finegoldii TaxID=338188 RepID=UPI0021CEBF32|nr:winged helix-turn-helix transcriptional regulator [Bacteroides finegoldii]